MKTRLGRDLDAEPVDAGQLTLECLRYMYRMLFVLFIESDRNLAMHQLKHRAITPDILWKVCVIL